MDAQSYIDHWGVWPDDDRHKSHLPIEDVVTISESPYRLPVRFANEIYRAGESGMGYHLFTLVFRDGTRQAYVSGGAVDFVRLPVGKSFDEISAVHAHEGRGDSQMETEPYAWCLFGEGYSDRRSYGYVGRKGP